MVSSPRHHHSSTFFARLCQTVPWQSWMAMLVVFGAALATSLAPSPAWGAAPESGPAPANGTAAGTPSYGALADLLDNAASRDALIQQLRELAKSAPAASAPASGGLPAEAGEQTFSRRIANTTQAFLEGVVEDFRDAVVAFQTLGRGEGVRGVTLEEWIEALVSLGIVIAATVLAYALFRLMASRIYARIDRWVAAQLALNSPSGSAATLHTGNFGWYFGKLYRYLVAMFGALLIDIGVILLAGVVGYAVGVWRAGTGGLAVLDSMFVNAFLAVEIAKALVRVVFATRYQHLRLLTMADDIAIYWNAWLAHLISWTGYGILIAVPLLKAMFSAAIGQLIGLLLMVGVYIYAVRVIWRNRKLLRDRLERRANLASTAFFSTLIRMLARIWHLLAIGYFTVLLVVSQIAPESALPFMARATGQSLIAIAIGLILSTLMSIVLAQRIRLSDSMRTRLPMLEKRVNAYVPATIKALRTLILVCVVLVVLDAWGAFNLPQWLASESGSRTLGTLVHVGIILLIAALMWTVIASIIEHRLSTTSGQGAPSARERTLLALFRNAALIVIVTMTILIVLSQIGINIAPLIAGAGVVGLAIGFGAQKLVQDIITGIFIQLENGMNQNDVVEAAGVFGTVEKITIRSVGIRTLDGGYHLIPFSSVDTVVNHMRDFSYHLGEYTIAHRESVDDAIFHLERAFDELKQDTVLAPEIMEDMTVAGVTSLNERGFTIRVLIKTTPGMQWAIQRAYNRLVKKHFNAANIELPYPHTVVYFGQDKNGSAVQPEHYPAGDAPGAGQMPHVLPSANVQDSKEALGNELDTVVDDEGKPKSERIGEDKPTR